MEAAKGAEKQGGEAKRNARTNGMPRGVMRAMFRLDAGVGSRRYLKVEPAGPPGEPPDDAAPASRDGEAGGGQRMGRAI
ncbi:hypothetical protein [Burkholderia anthina]|uniref:Uncharacterized protein n=1 Tax=Burkholderia anthina TaxID=179879 RepID=A0AAW3PQV1_9BURK|nr:hypothetical protein [Burkholderia anthina]KWZ31109.1 hypothetical protein WS64_22605 [Burkholderia anthina]